MEHAHAVEILTGIHTDSKFFRGILAAADAWPVLDKRKNLARFLINLGDAILDTPQRDLFETAAEIAKPRTTGSTIVECPECHLQQPDGGERTTCGACGYGPMPTAYVLSAERVYQHLKAVLQEPIEREIIDEWTPTEWEEAITWAKKTVDEPEVIHPMPEHVRIANDVATGEAADSEDRVARVVVGDYSELSDSLPGDAYHYTMPAGTLLRLYKRDVGWSVRVDNGSCTFAEKVDHMVQGGTLTWMGREEQEPATQIPEEMRTAVVGDVLIYRKGKDKLELTCIGSDEWYIKGRNFGSLPVPAARCLPTIDGAKLIGKERSDTWGKEEQQPDDENPASAAEMAGAASASVSAARSFMGDDSERIPATPPENATRGRSRRASASTKEAPIA